MRRGFSLPIILIFGAIIILSTSAFILIKTNIICFDCAEESTPIKTQNSHVTQPEQSSKPISEEQRIIPDEIIKRANDYIISKVGKDYFNNNYKIMLHEKGEEFAWQKSYKDLKPDGNENNNEYFLYYEYIPLTKISGETEVVFIRMFDKPDFVPYDYVACVENNVVCEPKITKIEAIEIAQKLGGNVSKLKPTLQQPSITRSEKIKNWTWSVEYNSVEQADCGTSSAIFIDAVTGEKHTSTGKVCQ